jgi:hypothetical protein
MCSATGDTVATMFHPVGHQTPSVYWRRRLVLAAALVLLLVLIIVTGKVVFGSSGKSPSGLHGSTSPVNHTTSTPPPTQTTTTSAPPSTSTAPSSPTGTGSSSVVAKPCTASQLVVSAATDKTTYTVGAEPVLSLQVIDKAAVPCVQDLADSQVLMRVYNGVSRVWGSHDCQIQPGKDLRTLAAGQAVKVSVVWSGLSSQPNCAGTRQRVGAGTYTLYVSLSGQSGTSAQFAIQ